ncbi:MAG: succinyl-CoA synthetase subunit beta [Candidatus Aminicenantes bacterium]|nr:succinyl-CoA synthetase subunit beta [Candidatus Aminicenantes bacterium]
MARLFEYQSKKLLKQGGIPVPEGKVVSSPEQAAEAARELGRPVVLKAQVWATGRAEKGGIHFADSPEEARKAAREILAIRISGLSVEKILVEEKIDIQSEYFAGLVIDDAEKSPVMLFSSKGGTGIEEIARKHPDQVARAYVNVSKGFREYEARDLIRQTGVFGKTLTWLSRVLAKFFQVSQKYDARSAEMNPLVLASDGTVYAADCHFVVDDYAVFRHPDLGIEVAREFDRPPTELEKIAYQVEKNDHRGTFYFFQMLDEVDEKENVLGFNGAGGGGSMMSMDAVLDQGFKLANYCDTSGNPSASKVYRAAKIILSQPHIKGYFASGSGVASQEQFHSARGLTKAFKEEGLEIPAVLRLGGNFEEKAIEILHTYLKDIPGKVEGYGREDSPEFCAERMKKLITDNDFLSHKVRPLQEPEITEEVYSFQTPTGEIRINQEKCLNCSTKACIEACTQNILKLEQQKPVLAISREDTEKGKCTECLACEIFCTFHEQDAIFIHLPIKGLKEYREKVIRKQEKCSDRRK